MPIRAPDPFGSFIAGRQARQDVDYADNRNALARMELEQAPANMQRKNKLADMQVAGAQQQLDSEKARIAHAQLSQALQSGNPKAFVLQNIPDLARHLQAKGVNLASMDDESAGSVIEDMARQVAGAAGIMPAAPAGPMSAQGKIGADVRGGYLTQEQADAALNPGMNEYQRQRLEIERQKLNRGPQDTGPLVQVAGPDGNPVYRTREQAVGQPAYVARDKPAAADLKYQREIKSKRPRLQAAVRRIDRLASAVQNIAGNTVFDGGPMDAKALQYMKQGQEVIQAAASLTPELTALTRVPGIGSQSDLESRLASLQLPSLEFAPEVNAKAVEELRAFVRDLQDAYGSVEGEFQSAEVESLLDKYAPK